MSIVIVKFCLLFVLFSKNISLHINTWRAKIGLVILVSNFKKWQVYGKNTQKRKGGRGETGGVYLPSQLERIHHNFARDGIYCRVKGGGRVPPTLTRQSWVYHHDGMYARKWPLPVYFTISSEGKPTIRLRTSTLTHTVHRSTRRWYTHRAR